MKNRKAELAGEQKGYLASLAGTIVGAKFVERDEVRPDLLLCFSS
jgi:hypothetical protein